MPWKVTGRLPSEHAPAIWHAGPLRSRPRRCAISSSTDALVARRATDLARPIASRRLLRRRPSPGLAIFNAVHPPTVTGLGHQIQVKLLADHTCQGKPAYRVLLPSCCRHHRRNSRSRWAHGASRSLVLACCRSVGSGSVEVRIDAADERERHVVQPCGKVERGRALTDCCFSWPWSWTWLDAWIWDGSSGTLLRFRGVIRPPPPKPHLGLIGRQGWIPAPSLGAELRHYRSDPGEKPVLSEARLLLALPRPCNPTP